MRPPLRSSLLLPLFLATGSLARGGDGHQVEVAKKSLEVMKIAPASDEAQNAIQQFKLADGLSVSLWAAEPMLANPVGFTTDNQGRWYVAETFRLHAGVSDIRAHMDWLEAELASTGADSWLAILKGDPKFGAELPKTNPISERLQMLSDSTGSGKADKSTVFAEGLDGPLSGIAASVLERKGNVYLTNIPELIQFKDTRGTGTADQRKTLASGFGVRTAFLGHDLHGLRFGPDGRLYFTIGDRGANATAWDGSKVRNLETGAVYRCNQDGSQLEIFATGLRNPQDLAFDQYGNLFTGDNNSDAGDPARLVYVLQGGDSGWRIGWQFLTQPPRGPWLTERFCYPAFDGQAAHHVPPVAVLGNGPSGLTYNPGTGLSEAWKGHFFLADFRGSPANSGIHSFTVIPNGAGYEMSATGKPLWSILATDVEFGVDGGLYVLDWVNGWGMPGKGRIYKVTDSKAAADPLVAQTKALLAEGMAKRSIAELTDLLGHADMRVRQEAQFELVDRVEASALRKSTTKKDSLPARLHGIWGLGQLARNNSQFVKDLVPLLTDADPEVRAQAAKTLGDLKEASAANSFIALLKDESPRVRCFAAIALSRIGYSPATEALLAALRENPRTDAVLRYATVSGLAACASPETLAQAAQDPSNAVRIGAVNALRRLKDPRVSAFLKDSDPLVLAEAARAIYDESIEKALPELANLLSSAPALLGLPQGTKELPGQRDAVLRRLIHANFRVGLASNAKALAEFACLEAAPESLRVEALTRLGEWPQPSNLDKLMGLYRPLPPRDITPVTTDAAPSILSLVHSAPKTVRLAALSLVTKFGFRASPLNLLGVVKDVQTESGSRSVGGP
ncbi:MAG: hypothetical protein EBS01_06920 [Verrucomicrobia bacterium]|nr:hypothetical protein [Verrucomicrobiota bacterium]